MSLDQANTEPTASHSTNCAGFSPISAVVLALPHVFLTLLHFSSTCTWTGQWELINTKFLWHQLFLISNLGKTMISQHSCSPEVLQSVLQMFCSGCFSSSCVHKHLCQERMTTPLFILLLPWNFVQYPVVFNFGNKFPERYIDIFSLSYCSNLGNWLPGSGIWGLIVPLLAALVPAGSAWGRSVFCTVWQNEVVTELHEKAGLGVTVLHFRVLHFSSFIPPIHLHWRSSSAKSR